MPSDDANNDPIEPQSHPSPLTSFLPPEIGVIARSPGRSTTFLTFTIAAITATTDGEIVLYDGLKDGKAFWRLQGLEQNPDTYEPTTTPDAAMLPHDANDSPIIAMPPTNAWSWCVWVCCQCGQSQSIAIYKLCTRCGHRKCPGCIPY